jgi:hypothetical protein
MESFTTATNQLRVNDTDALWRAPEFWHGILEQLTEKSIFVPLCSCVDNGRLYASCSLNHREMMLKGSGRTLLE